MTDELEPAPESLPKPHPVVNKKFQHGGRPAAYLAFLPGLFTLCEELGYNLMVHGSLCRDFDLCAVAWAHGAVHAADLVDAVAKHVGGKIQDSIEHGTDAFDYTLRAAEPKIHGRYAWTIHLMSGPMIDLSVVGPESDSIHKMMRRLEESAAHFQSIWKLPDAGSQEVRTLMEETMLLRGNPSNPMAQARIGYEVARRLLIRQGMSNKISNELFPPEPEGEVQLPAPVPIVGEAGRNSVRWGFGFTEAQVRAIVAKDRALRAYTTEVNGEDDGTA